MAGDDVVIGSVLIVVCVQLVLPLLHEVRVTALCANRAGAVRALLLVGNISFIIRDDKLILFIGQSSQSLELIKVGVLRVFVLISRGRCLVYLLLPGVGEG